jgi:hypothetical protein
MGLAIASCLVSNVAAGAPANQARLSWVRAEGAGACPPAQVVRDGVVKKLGYDPFSDDAPRSFEVVAKRESASWRAHIYSHDAQRGTSGFREIQSDADDCAELVGAVALAIALAIDPEGALAAAPPAAAPPPQRAPTVPASQRERVPPAPCPPAAPPAGWRATLTARGLAAFGALPRSAAGAAIAATAYGPSRTAFSTGAWLLPSVRTSPDAPIFGFGLTAGWLDACFVLHEGASASARACAGLRAGLIHAVVYTPVPTDPGDRFWWALGSSLAAEQRVIGRVFVEAGIEVMMPLVRYRFFAENFDRTVFEQSRAIGAAFVGVGFRID